LDAGANIAARDPERQTPLHLAARDGFHASCLVLLHRGADLHAQDQWGETPLHQAADRSQTATGALLLHHGADPLALDHAGQPGDTDLVITTAVLADPQTAPATCEHLRVHAVRHLADQPAQAARILELISARG
jgi:ankyrin repeat protein